MLDLLTRLTAECWQVLGEMSPYLLFGFLVAGLLSVWISPAWVERHLGGRGLKPVLKAAIFGVPLPLCSCGVIPVSASIHRHGANRAATTAFLLSTPQTGLDSIAATYALLGPVFAAFRPIAALLTGLLGGGLVLLLDPETGSAGNATEQTLTNNSPPETGRKGAGRCRRLLQGLGYGLITLPRDIAAALLVGVLVAGLMGTLVPPNRLSDYLGGGILSILLLMAAGVPIYVCATASVPIAAGFMHMGASAGAALAFLIAGPATNAATFTTIWKILGRRSAILYLATIAISAVGCGLLLNELTAITGSVAPYLGEHLHSGGRSGAWPHIWAVVLLTVLAVSYFVSPRPSASEAPAETGEKDMQESAAEERVELVVTGMTCNHCTAAVGRALTACPGVRKAEVDLATGRAVVRGHPLDPQSLLAAVNELGYEARVAEAK